MPCLSIPCLLFCVALEIRFLPNTDVANENEGQLEASIFREADIHMGSDVTLRLVFVIPDLITDDDARPGKNTTNAIELKLETTFQCVPLLPH